MEFSDQSGRARAEDEDTLTGRGRRKRPARTTGSLQEQRLIALFDLGVDPIDLGPEVVDQARLDAEVARDPFLPCRARDVRHLLLLVIGEDDALLEVLARL